jgi:hypothetical protein
MRDPAENKDIHPSMSWPDDRDGLYVIPEVLWRIKAARDRMRVLSLTRDAEDGGGSYPEFDCCWARPRMWEQYGDNHRGACLLFDPTRLERAIHEQWPEERTHQLGNVDCTREGSAEVYERVVDAAPILDDEEPARAVADYLNANRDAYFFVKSDDFATEYEYRVVLAAKDDDRDDRDDRNEYAYVD